MSTMNLTIDPAIMLKLGFLHLTDCRIVASSEALLKIYDEVANTAKKRFADTPLGEHPVAGGVRRLFKSAGIDPSRYRPSGEALVRRILKGQGLYHINCIVDINNICSIESLFPLGVYDREHIIGDINIRLGASDEVYRGIGKEINIAGKLVSADGESSPVGKERPPPTAPPPRPSSGPRRHRAHASMSPRPESLKSIMPVAEMFL